MRHISPILGLLIMAGCADTGRISATRDASPDLSMASQNAPENAPDGTCWDKSETPAKIETVTEDILVQPAQISSTGTIQAPPVYRSQTRQIIVEPRQVDWTQIPCTADLTPDFIASVQRALALRGLVTLTVFDAARTVDLPEDACCSLGDSNGNRRTDYQIQNDRIFSGRAAVTGGRFTATFLVPQDISYSGQTARVAAYVNGQATGGSVDGFGQSEDAIVSPVAGTRPNDNEGPSVRLFLNDTTFVAGSAVAPGATLIATLQDPSGINTVGAGVGHTLLLTIDGDAATAIDVGSAYVGDVGTYRSGQIRFPLPELAPGPHTLTLTAWDAVNNASTAELAFVMEEGEALAVRSVLPFPNPTAGPTRFVFEHNRVGSPARVQLRIYTLAGRPIRTIGPDEALPGGLLTSSSVQIPWDGLDDDQDRLASGVYLFRLRLEIPGDDGGTEVAERVERLAIIR